MPDLSFTKEFDYTLPTELIANNPLPQRDASRLLLLNKQTGEIQHKHFYELFELLTDQDVLVLNQSKVFPARLFGNINSGKVVEVLLVNQQSSNVWRAITRPGLRPNMQIAFPKNVTAKVVNGNKATGEVDIEFSYSQENIFAVLEEIGQIPIPTYIHSSLSESLLRQRYQTIYATKTGSIAAPTAGLHFTDKLVAKIKNKGVQMEYITLHVGLGTFQSLRKENFETKQLHTESYEVTLQVANRLNKAKRNGKRIISVGTTTTRTLESIVSKEGKISAGEGCTQLFIYPPYKFKFVDSLITNFHLPQSSLLMLINAFTSTPNTQQPFKNFQESAVGVAYQQAINNKYRFYSFGDAMWIF